MDREEVVTAAFDIYCKLQGEGVASRDRLFTSFVQWFGPPYVMTMSQLEEKLFELEERVLKEL
jgi:hypothetical protein